MEKEEVSIDGAPQGSIRTAEGDGYSKVVKRTVLRSEGDHTEVCGRYIMCVLLFLLFMGFFVFFLGGLY